MANTRTVPCASPAGHAHNRNAHTCHTNKHGARRGRGDNRPSRRCTCVRDAIGGGAATFPAIEPWQPRPVRARRFMCRLYGGTRAGAAAQPAPCCLPRWRAGHTHFNLLHMHAQAARTERQPAGTVPRARPMRAKGPTRLPKAPGRPRRCASVWDHGTGRAAARSLLPPSTGMPQQPLAILDIPALASHQHAEQ